MRLLLRSRVLGILFIGLMVLGVWFVSAIFNQDFTPFDNVTLKTDEAGLQLPERADVKVRGEIVGQVSNMTSNGKVATLTLGIDPSKIGAIPKNVSAAILPKTLFGEKYVSLDIPKDPSSQSLQAGDRITQVKLPFEVEKVLDDLYPLLRTVQPAQINYTLNALATALDGRGAALGNNIGVLAHYLQRMNPQVPTLVKDLQQLSTVSATYADVMPQIAATLRNTVTTTGTLKSKSVQLNSFLQNVAAFSDTTRGFLDANGQNIIRLGKVSAPQLALFAHYAPEYSCLLGGIVNAIPRQAQTFRGFVFHIDLIIPDKQPTGYNAGNQPVYGATNPPHCGTLPNPPYGPNNHDYNTPNFNDGYAAKRVAPSSYSGAGAVANQLSGTTTEKNVIRSLTAPVLGVPADRVGDLTTLLFGPLARGSEVSTR